MRLSMFAPLAVAAAVALAGCSDGTQRSGTHDEVLGPTDGTGLPPADLDRVAVGDEAPDFRLAALGGDRVQLSDFRGERNVVLVFYRGHW